MGMFFFLVLLAVVVWTLYRRKYLQSRDEWMGDDLNDKEGWK